MAVYTHVEPDDVAALLEKYNAGTLISLKGIAEGVENSNYFVETTQSRFILTLYENRVNPDDLPFFHSMLDHLHRAGCLVPRFINDRNGNWLHKICGRSACLIEFLSGVSVSQPNQAQARSTGRALGEMHRALGSFHLERANSMGMEIWAPLAVKCDSAELDKIAPGLNDRLMRECAFLKKNWPHHLPRAAIHADLFPDNVLMLNDHVTGLIDFYFACTDIRAYDIAVTHAAWAFSNDGCGYHKEIGDALFAGYSEIFGIDAETVTALPILLRGAALRFLITRCYDWINTPAEAMVTRKDPLAFLRRLDFYSDSENMRTVLGSLT